jgi:hypothetical protein
VTLAYKSRIIVCVLFYVNTNNKDIQLFKLYAPSVQMYVHKCKLIYNTDFTVKEFGPVTLNINDLRF